MTPEEREVIQAAIRAVRDAYSVALDDLRAATENLIYNCTQCNHDQHVCPGCGEPIGHGDGACLNCDPAIAGASLTRVDGTELCEPPRNQKQPKELTEEPVWVARTMQDVRTGDTVRLPAAPDRHARVLFALPLDWHVKQGDRSWQFNGNTYWNDTPLEHRLVSVRLDYEGVQLDEHGRPALLQLPAGTPVEISLTPSEVQATELLGWDNRLWVETETS